MGEADNGVLKGVAARTWVSLALQRHWVSVWHRVYLEVSELRFGMGMPFLEDFGGTVEKGGEIG